MRWSMRFNLGQNADRNVPRKPRTSGGVKGHIYNNTTLPGSPGLWLRSFIVSALLFVLANGFASRLV